MSMSDIHGIAQAAQGIARVQVVDTATQEVVHDTGWLKNLILNQGMDRVAQTVWADLFLQCAAGTGVTPTADDSGITTAAQSGTAVTLSGGSFVFTDTSTDAGKTIKWDSGQEAIISSVVSPTSLIMTTSATVGAGEFTVYRTNQVQLAAEQKRTNTYLTGSGNCGTTLVGNQLQMRRTYDFTSESGTVNYTELGWSWTSTPANTLFSRLLLPSVVTVLSGQQLRVIYQLNLTITPSTSQSRTAIISGWPVSPATTTDGQEQVQYIGTSSVTTAGASTQLDGASNTSEPSNSTSQGAFLSNVSTALASFNSAVDRTPSGITTNPYATLTNQSYTAGSYYRDKTATFAVGDGNGTTIRSMGVGFNTPVSAFAYQATRQALVFVFNEAQTKTNTHTLTLTWRWSWSRVLS